MDRRAALWFVVGSVLAWGAPASEARADRPRDDGVVTVAMLPAAGSPSVAADASRFVARITTRLRDAGWTVSPVVEEQLELARGVLGCDTDLCARAGLSALDVDLVLAPALWISREGAIELAIVVRGPSSPRLDLTLALPDLRDANRADPLVTQVVDRWREIGRSPELELDEADRRAPPPRSARSGWNAAIGLVLLAGATAPLALGGRAAIRDGACASPRDDGGCPVDPQSGRYLTYHFGARSVALLATGAVVAGVGAYFLAARPIRLTPSASRHHAAVGLTLEF